MCAVQSTPERQPIVAGRSAGEGRDGDSTCDRRVEEEAETVPQLALLYRIYPREMARTWINEKHAAVDRLQQRRHRFLRYRHESSAGPPRGSIVMLKPDEKKRVRYTYV
jgi:hypothetical protein